MTIDEFNNLRFIKGEGKYTRFQNRNILCNCNVNYLYGDKKEHLQKKYNFDEIIEYIDKNDNKDIQLESLCKQFLTNHTSISSKFKNILGMNFSEYLILRKIIRALYLLVYTSMSNSAISVNVGFCNSSNFHKWFKKIVGVTPCQYKQFMISELKKESVKSK
jgi:AraC-like DNA-binding protein